MPLINCKINLILTCSENCFMIDAPINNQVPAFTINDKKNYAPVVTLSTQDNANLLQQLKSNFERTINRNRYQSKVTVQEHNQYLDYLIDPSFQGVNRFFVLLFENNTSQASYSRYYLPLVEIKEYNIMIDRRKCLGQPLANNLIRYNNIQKFATDQGDDYKTGCLLDDNNKMIAIDLIKQQALDVHPKTIQQINFTANLNQPGNATMFSLLKKQKKPYFFVLI